MHLRSAFAIACVALVATAGCVEVRNMGELKAALGVVERPVEVLPPERPIAKAMAFPVEARMGEPIFFTSAGSFDPEGRALVFLWNFNDGTRGTGAEVRHAFDRPGLYRVELTVSDPDGLWDVAAVEVRIQPTNLPPTAALRILDARGTPVAATSTGVPLTFESTSSDPEGGALAHLWDFGDGATASQRKVSHAFAAPGRYAVSLSVADPAGLANRTTALVGVDLKETWTGVAATGDPALSFAFPGGPGLALEAVVAYDAAFGANDLALRIEDAEGRTLAASTEKPAPGAGGPANETVFLGAAALADAAPGTWRLVVELAAGARVPFTATLHLDY